MSFTLLLFFAYVITITIFIVGAVKKLRFLKMMSILLFLAEIVITAALILTVMIGNM